MAEETTNKTKKQLMQERLSQRYPDKQFEDDEAMYDQIGSDYDDYESQINDAKEREQGFSDLFTKDPRSARMVMDWKEGKDPAISLISLYGEDIRDVLDDPSRQEEIAKANKEYVDRVTKEKEYEKQYQANIQQSIQDLEAAKEQGGHSDEDMDKAMEFLSEIVSNGVVGKFTPEALQFALKALGYDQAVAEASENGETRGRNANIQEQLRKPAQQGDGTPSLEGTSGTSSRGQNQGPGGTLDNYGEDFQNIYERGGEKRVKNRG